MRRIMKIRRHGFVGKHSEKCSTNFSQFGPGAADLELKMLVQLAYFSLSRNREKLKFGGIPVYRCNKIITPREKPQRNQLSIKQQLASITNSYDRTCQLSIT